MAVGKEAGQRAFWTLQAGDAFAFCRSGPGGLDAAEGARRLAEDGPNLVAAAARRSLIAKLARRLAEPLVAILLLAAAISGATGDWRSFAVIAVIVLLSIALDLAQEQKAEAAIDALKRSVAVTAKVYRGGRAAEIPVRELVAGDVVALRAGDLVPADGIVLSARGLLASEAALTGEAFPVEKRPGPSAAALPADAFNALFAGTSIVAGEATMLVMATAGATRFGAIAASVQGGEAPTAFERGVHSLGMLILRLTGFLVLFVLLTQLVRHGLSIDGFLFAVALAVGLTPELLPMVMTVTLARGATRMAARKVVVKRLSAIHDLGGMDVLCTDKTGTLTEARIALVGSFGPQGGDDPRVADLARLNSHFASGTHSSLDDALLAGATMDFGAWTLVDDVPFDFERRRASVLVSRDGVTEMITKGAPEALLPLCTQAALPDGTVRPLDTALRAAIAALIEAKGRAGLRLLAIARRAMDGSAGSLSAADEAAMTFAGCVAFLDPPKASAGEAVRRLALAGIAVKIISGDAAPVVLHLAETLGLPARGVLSGEEIGALGDAALADRVATADLFVRVAPDQKARIVRALRRRGHTVGFLGDGINDAPAIHAADVGLSVDSGTDVAREAADAILLASDLGVLADGVAEGRRTHANIMKYVRMGTSSNFGNMLSTALASLVLPFLPLLPLQILLNNLVYDLSEIGIPFDDADPEDLARPRAWDMAAVLRFTLTMGPLSSLFDIITFGVLWRVFDAGAAVFQTAWFVESIVTQILVIFVIRTTRPVWASHPHPVLASSSIGALAVALAVALTGLGQVVGFVPLPLPVLAAMGGISIAYLASAEVLKRVALRPAPDRRHPGHA